MHRLQCKMASQAHFLDPASLIQVFSLMDADGSGRLNGEEVQAMFNTMCGREVQVTSALESYSLSQFQETVERSDRQYPQFKIAANLMKYLKENMAEPPAENAINEATCTKMYGILDADGTGELELAELFRAFKFLGIHVEQLIETYTDHANITSPEELMQVLQEMDEKYPNLSIDEKVVQFLGEAAAAGGGKPDTSTGDDQAEDPAAEEPGTKKAFLVGINYIGKRSELGGCINDVRNQLRVLTEQFGFEPENILMLSEDQDDDAKLPTKANIQAGFAWLFDGASGGDELFFQYSGHGSQCADRTGDESDGKNECICPLDCDEGPWPDAVILDNEIYSTFYEGLPDGAKCVCVFDCCHSATVADLQCTRTFSLEPPEEEDKPRWLEPGEEEQAALDGVDQESSRQVAERGSSPGGKNLWTYSGCQDNQTSADATIDGLRQGALTWGFIKALTDLGWKARHEDLLAATRKNLKGRYTQIPALSTTCEEHFRVWYLDRSE